MYPMNHCWNRAFLKPIVFAGASAVFLFLYLSIWTVHDGRSHLSSANSASTSEPIVDAAFDAELEALYTGMEEVRFCNSSNHQTLHASPIPVIYFVTPTYSRPVQIAELTRLGQTLQSVPSLHWILVEDSEGCSPVIGDLLKRLGIPFTHLTSSMPAAFRKHPIQPRGVSNRRAALHWIRSNVHQGVLYFGDDDNTYDLRLFEEIRFTRHISMFPVGLIGDYSVSAPVVKDGKVVGFYDSWPAGRRYAVDMAGFAVNIRLLHEHPNATIIYKAGYEEDHFLKGLHVEDRPIEAKASNCTQILVWHTRTVKVPSVSLQPLREDDHHLMDTSMPSLFHALEDLHLATFSSKKGKENSVHYLTSI